MTSALVPSDTTVLPEQATSLLGGVTVVDLGQIYNAPYATMLMAHAGAHVIKVEPPGGERNRKRVGTHIQGAGFPFHIMNSSKLGVTLNLKTQEGRELLVEMADKADVLVENFRPGVMERLGLGPETLRARHPELIYASSSGFGRDSGYGALAAMDVTIQAMSGAMTVTGYEDDPPVKSGAAIADFFAGVHLYGAVVTALVRRQRSGKGAVLDVSMMDAVLPSMIPSLSAALARGGDSARVGNHDLTRSCAPYGMYPTRDGHVVVTVIDDTQWHALVGCLTEGGIGVPPGLGSAHERIAEESLVDKLLGSWTQQHTTSEVMAAAELYGAPCVPVRHLAEVVRDPQFRRRGLLVDMELDGVGRLPVLRSPINVANEPKTSLSPTPALGQDNEAVYGDWLGLSKSTLEDYRQKGVL